MKTGYLDIDRFEGTPLALEAGRLADGEPWCISQVAGLQFYTYWKRSELIGRVEPQPGDAVSLMRRPDNTADADAIEVWWRNAYQLGHLPHGVAAALAPRMDHGESVRGYVLDGGDGSAWSVELALVGRGVEPLHQLRLQRLADEHEAALRREAKEASEAIWSSRPTSRQERAAEAWEARQDAARRHRRSDALVAFGRVPMEPLPEASLQPDETLRGRDITQWDKVPAWLSTETALRARGYKAAGRPFAWKTGGYGPYALYLVCDAQPMRPRVKHDDRGHRP